MLKPLSPRQNDALTFLVEYIFANGYPPSNRELCADMGISSTNGTLDHLRALERKGWITRRHMGSRCIALTPAAIERLGCPCCGQKPVERSRQ